ncbi:peptide MFS transporter [Terrisporobacter glycolicus]|uniref:Di-/tripeptide transporter n=1 Tax=Terrisporobacter glycolicus ATCC 14880 = DSM 1288 TaxID=1121315 RepID=A0ABZ2EUY5_9FIRM|nr:peptide MFS transporter [Terrisporobacter glycolicus]
MVISTKSKIKYPMGFYVCTSAYALERMAFYSAKWLIAIFIAAEVIKGGLGLTPADGAKMTANLVAFTYLTPILGGFIADRWISPRLCVILGALIMGAGYVLGYQASVMSSPKLLSGMILLVSIGTGLYKGNIAGISGRLFKDKSRLDSAFSIQYSIANMGSFLGTLIVSFIAYKIGFGKTFLVCALLLLVSAIWFYFGGRATFGEIGKKPFEANENKTYTNNLSKDYRTPLTLEDKKKIGAIILFSVFSVVFWIVWYLTYMPVLYHWGPDFDYANKANWVIGNFRVPSSWFDSLNSLCCIILGPVLAAVWSRNAKSSKGDMSIFKKTAMGMMLLGLAFILMCTAEILRGDGQASLMWIIAVGILISIGEMVFAPLGKSFISKFSPPRLLGLMMGVWPLARFIAGKTYGYLYEMLSGHSFVYAYGIVSIIVILCGITIWLLDKKISLLEDRKNEAKETV